MQHHTFKKLFGPEAANYTKYRLPYPEQLFTLLTQLIPHNSTSILDCACGTGKSTEPLTKTNLHVTGIDHDPLMIAEATKQAHLKKLTIDYRVADAEHLPFPDNQFDVVTIGTAFHFFVNEAAMSELLRVLKPKGLLFVYWTLTTKDIPEKDEIPGAIYRKYNWIKIPPVLRSLEHTSHVFTDAGLTNVSTKSIPIIFNTTVEERVGLQTTSGVYETLSPEDKINFLHDVRETLTKNLGDRPHFTLEEEIQVCFGFKR
jgi:SAM-dependent methyltransferase